jgi:hypothetical protein
MSMKITRDDRISRDERIFVLADTHNRLPEGVTEMAKDADGIWHLGDVCAQTILDELRAIGPAVIVALFRPRLVHGRVEW